MEDTQQASPLLELPAELMYHILSYLSPVDLARIAPTCHHLKNLSYDDRIWRDIISKNLP